MFPFFIHSLRHRLLTSQSSSTSSIEMTALAKAPAGHHLSIIFLQHYVQKNMSLLQVLLIYLFTERCGCMKFNRILWRESQICQQPTTFILEIVQRSRRVKILLMRESRCGARSKQYNWRVFPLFFARWATRFGIFYLVLGLHKLRALWKSNRPLSWEFLKWRQW